MWLQVASKATFEDPSSPSLIELMSLDIGPIYNDMTKNSLYGYLPLMVGCSIGQLGALNAESFCERVLSCANNVVKVDNTLLDDFEVEMLVTLRMNKAFMEFMRVHYGDLLREQFGMQIIP